MFRPKLRPMPDPVGGVPGNSGGQYIRQNTRFNGSTDDPKVKGFSYEKGGTAKANYTIDGQKIEITFKDNETAGTKGVFDISDQITSMKVDGKEVSSQIGDLTRQKIINRNLYDVQADSKDACDLRLDNIADLEKNGGAYSLDTFGKKEVGKQKETMRPIYNVSVNDVPATVTGLSFEFAGALNEQQRDELTCVKVNNKVIATFSPGTPISMTTILDEYKNYITRNRDAADQNMKVLDAQYEDIENSPE